MWKLTLTTFNVVLGHQRLLFRDFLWFFFFRFFFFFNPTYRPTQYQEMHSTLNQKKGGWPSTKWDSFTPRKYKINLIRSFTYRCYQICFSSSLLQSALNDLRKLPLQNGYPQGIINFNIKWFAGTKPQQARWPCTYGSEEGCYYSVTLFRLSPSNQISKRLKSCIYQFYSSVNLKIFFSKHCRKCFSSYKDRLNRLLLELSVIFTLVKLSDGSMTERLNTSSP